MDLIKTLNDSKTALNNKLTHLIKHTGVIAKETSLIQSMLPELEIHGLEGISNYETTSVWKGKYKRVDLSTIFHITAYQRYLANNTVFLMDDCF